MESRRGLRCEDSGPSAVRAGIQWSQLTPCSRMDLGRSTLVRVCGGSSKKSLTNPQQSPILWKRFQCTRLRLCLPDSGNRKNATWNPASSCLVNSHTSLSRICHICGTASPCEDVRVIACAPLCPPIIARQGHSPAAWTTASGGKQRLRVSVAGLQVSVRGGGTIAVLRRGVD